MHSKCYLIDSHTFLELLMPSATIRVEKIKKYVGKRGYIVPEDYPSRTKVPLVVFVMPIKRIFNNTIKAS